MRSSSLGTSYSGFKGRIGMRGLGILLGLLVSLLVGFTPFSAEPVLAKHILTGGSPTAGTSAIQDVQTPEQQLADRYSPVVYLRQASSDICSGDYEGFDPIPVDFVLGRNDIPLMASDNGKPSGERTVVVRDPAASDLYGQGPSTFLNYPGSPGSPRCTYRQAFQERKDGVPNVAYAHIYLQPGTRQLALQYWMFYYLNDWNNTHEGDWEMIMLLFNTTSVEEALGQEPATVVYAQHGGGERADWSDKKLTKEDGHPVIYVARGAHASEYQPKVYLGLAEHGTGFGCENSTGPHRRLALSAIVVPHEPAGPGDEFAWLGYTGRWGELQRSEWSGPTGPNTKDSWNEPVTWADGVRDSSLTVPAFEGFGEAPVNLFCGAVAGGSHLLVAFSAVPALTVGLIGLVLASIGWIANYVMETIRQAYRLYRQYLVTFGLIGGLLFPVGFIVATAQTLLFFLPPTSTFLAIMDRFPGIRIVLTLAFGSLNVALAVIVVAPAVTVAVNRIREGKTPRALECYHQGLHAVWRILLARLVVAVRILLGAITIVGIPRAIRRLIDGFFIGQTVVLLDVSRDKAIDYSSAAASRSRARTLLTSVVLNIVVLLTGPLVAIFLLLAIPSRPIGLINYVSSVLFALLYPISVMGMTLLYYELRPSTERQSTTEADWPDPTSVRQGSPQSS